MVVHDIFKSVSNIKTGWYHCKQVYIITKAFNINKVKARLCQGCISLETIASTKVMLYVRFDEIYQGTFGPSIMTSIQKRGRGSNTNEHSRKFRFFWPCICFFVWYSQLLFTYQLFSKCILFLKLIELALFVLNKTSTPIKLIEVIVFKLFSV